MAEQAKQPLFFVGTSRNVKMQP